MSGLAFWGFGGEGLGWAEISPRLRAGNWEPWEEALPIPTDPPLLRLSPNPRRSSSAWLSSPDPASRTSSSALSPAACGLAPNSPDLWASHSVPGPASAAGLQTTAWAATCPIKSIPDATLLCPESLQMGHQAEVRVAGQLSSTEQVLWCLTLAWESEARVPALVGHPIYCVCYKTCISLSGCRSPICGRGPPWGFSIRSCQAVV